MITWKKFMDTPVRWDKYARNLMMVIMGFMMLSLVYVYWAEKDIGKAFSECFEEISYKLVTKEKKDIKTAEWLAHRRCKR